MLNQNKLLGLEIKLMIGIICLIGVLLHIWSEGNLSILLFFTMQSNILVILFYIINVFFIHSHIIVNGLKGNISFLPRLKGAVIVAITATCLIYHLFFPKTTGSLADSIVHTIIPIMCILDWLIFDEKHKFRWFDPILWTIFPFVYLMTAISITDGSLGIDAEMPYFFLDKNFVGERGLVFYVVFFLMIYIILGEVFYIIDRFATKKIKPV